MTSLGGGTGIVARLAISLVSLIVLAGCTLPADDKAQIDGGVGAFVVGEYGEAEDRLKDVVRVNPDNGYALITLGNVYERIGRIDDARAAYLQAAAHFGEVHAEAMGVRATEREALAALAREKLARLQGSGGASAQGAQNATISPSTLKAVFVNLKKITENLRALSVAARGLPSGPSSGPSSGPPLASASGGTGVQMTALPQPPPVPRTPPATSANGRGKPSPGVWLHLASYRSTELAGRGWKEVADGHSEILDGLGYDYARIDFGAGMGVFYRVLAGPAPSERAARDLCKRMKRSGAYCSLVFF